MEKDLERELEMLKKSIRYGSKLCIYDVDFSIVEADDDYAELVGLEAREKDSLAGMKVRDCIHPEDVSRIAEEVYGFEEKSGEYECRYRLKVKDGNYIWVRDTGMVIERDGRKYVKSVVVDIDEREMLIRQRDVTYESVPGGVVFLVIEKDNFYIREANRYYFEMMGTEREGYPGSPGKYTFPEDLPGLREYLVTQAASHLTIDYEFRARREEDGMVRWYQMLGNYYDTREEGEEYLVILIDITSRKTAQFDLIKEKEKYRREMRNTADLMYEYNVHEEELRLFGKNYVTEDTVLCIDDITRLNYKKILFDSEFIYRGDRGKLVFFIKNEQYRYDNIRMLTKNMETGKKYYDNYEFYINKVYEKEKLSRVVGYVKKVSYMTVPVTVRQELHQIFDEQILKDYSFILKIDVPTESFVPYFVDGNGWEDYRGNRYYDSFLFWWAKNRVMPEDQKEISFFLSLEQMLRILHSGEPKGYRFCRVRENGQNYKHMICSFSFYGSDVNTIIFWVRDVTMMRADDQYQEMVNQKLLTDALTEARQSIGERKAFMDYIVKELNTPVMLMKEMFHAEQRQENLEEIEKGIDYLGEIIGGIREYNQLQAPPNRSENAVNLYDICSGVCEEGRKVSLGLDISIHENIALPKGKRYYVHEFRFKEMFINLLGNAIKYAPKGSGISLYVKEEKQENDRCRISITMEDDGAVISGRFLERSVNFMDEHTARDKIAALGSTGSSISLASKIADLLGGTVEFRKGVIHNCIVQLDIPVYLSGQTGELAEKLTKNRISDVHESDLGGQGILLVEKDGDTDKLTAPLLRANGAKVYVASSGAEASALLDEFNTGIISAILADQELTDMNCYEFARKIRYTSGNKLREIPLIVMTEAIQSTDTRESLISGINASISKPIKLKKLVRIIESFQGKM
ncbi:MAG: PAS domain S-box protein [Roseburia sp.]|nr:PAS domain S-box protein [Roseburia sp.]